MAFFLKPVAFFIISTVFAAMEAVPGDVLNLTRWKLTLPLDKDDNGEADEIKQPRLRTFTINPWFMAVPDGVQFRANVESARTSSRTKFPRSELREMTDDGRKSAAWDCRSADKSLSITQKITHTPVKKPEITVGQVHDADNDLLMILYTGPKRAKGTGDIGKLEALLNNSSKTILLTDSYELGTWFTLDIRVQEGKVSVRYNGMTQVDAVPWSIVSGPCYFKAGAYTQSNTDYDENGQYGEVVIAKLQLDK